MNKTSCQKMRECSMSMTQELASNWVLSSEKNGVNKSAEDEPEMSTTINYTNEVSVLVAQDDIKAQLNQSNSPI
jgi:hypothetical protein